MMNNIKRISFVNNCNCIVDYNVLERAINWANTGRMLSVKTIYMHGAYPAVTVNWKKIHVHRLIKSFTEGRALLRTEIVHHVNCNKLDSTAKNLMIIDPQSHASAHNKGKVLSLDHRRKISDKNRLRKGSRYKNRRDDVKSERIYRLKKSGMTFNQISIEIGMDWGCVKTRYERFIHDNPDIIK